MTERPLTPLLDTVDTPADLKRPVNPPRDLKRRTAHCDWNRQECAEFNREGGDLPVVPPCQVFMDLLA